MEPWLKEQGESYSMQCCESHVKEQENLLQKKQNNIWIWKAQSLIVQGWPPAEMYSSQRQEKKPTKTVSRIQDLRKQDPFKENNNQTVI